VASGRTCCCIQRGSPPMKMLLGGKRADAVSGREFEVLNPATGEVIDTVPQAGPEDVRLALGFARAGRRVMSALPAHQRSDILKRTGELIARDLEALTKLL